MFLSGTLIFHQRTSSEALTAAAESAWRQLRFKHPQLVARAAYLAGEAYMFCEIPEKHREVDAWVSQTISVGQSVQKLGFPALREKLLERKGGLDSEASFLLLNVIRDQGGCEGEDAAMCVEFVFNVDHQVTDGIGIRILLSRYLSLLAGALSRSQSLLDREFEWRCSAENLSVPWVAVMNDKQEVSGVEYERLVKSNQSFMFQQLASNISHTFLIRHLSTSLKVKSQ